MIAMIHIDSFYIVILLVYYCIILCSYYRWTRGCSVFWSSDISSAPG